MSRFFANIVYNKSTRNFVYPQNINSYLLMRNIKMNIPSPMKKVAFLLLLCFAVIPAVFAQNNSSRLSVVLKAGKITVSKKNITKDWTIASVVKILDTATEKIPGNYIKHVFDNLGIVLFERTENKIATGELA